MLSYQYYQIVIHTNTVPFIWSNTELRIRACAVVASNSIHTNVLTVAVVMFTLIDV